MFDFSKKIDTVLNLNRISKKHLPYYDNFQSFISSIVEKDKNYFYISKDFIKKIPTSKWMSQKRIEFSELVYIDDDFQPISNQEHMKLYDNQIKLDENKFNNLIEILKEFKEFKVKNLSVCDIGCSYGAFINCWSKQYTGKTKGVDISINAKKLSQQLFGNNHEVYVQDATNIIQKILKNIDIVTCFDFIEHLFNLELFLYKLSNLINSKTILVFYIPVFKQNHMNLEILSNHRFFTESHIYYFTNEGFKNLISKQTKFKFLYEKTIGDKAIFIYLKE